MEDSKLEDSEIEDSEIKDSKLEDLKLEDSEIKESTDITILDIPKDVIQKIGLLMPVTAVNSWGLTCQHFKGILLDDDQSWKNRTKSKISDHPIQSVDDHKTLFRDLSLGLTILFCHSKASLRSRQLFDMWSEVVNSMSEVYPHITFLIKTPEITKSTDPETMTADELLVYQKQPPLVLVIPYAIWDVSASKIDSTNLLEFIKEFIQHDEVAVMNAIISNGEVVHKPLYDADKPSEYARWLKNHIETTYCMNEKGKIVWSDKY